MPDPSTHTKTVGKVTTRIILDLCSVEWRHKITDEVTTEDQITLQASSRGAEPPTADAVARIIGRAVSIVAKLAASQAGSTEPVEAQEEKPAPPRLVIARQLPHGKQN